MRGLVIAGAIGYLIGTLWAPRKGSHLRADLRERIKKMRADGESFVQDGINESENVISDVKEKGKELKSVGAETLAKAGAAANRAGKIAGDSLENLKHDAEEIAEKGKNILTDSNHKE